MPRFDSGSELPGGAERCGGATGSAGEFSAAGVKAGAGAEKAGGGAAYGGGGGDLRQPTPLTSAYRSILGGKLLSPILHQSFSILPTTLPLASCLLSLLSAFSLAFLQASRSSPTSRPALSERSTTSLAMNTSRRARQVPQTSNPAGSRNSLVDSHVPAGFYLMPRTAHAHSHCIPCSLLTEQRAQCTCCRCSCCRKRRTCAGTASSPPPPSPPTISTCSRDLPSRRVAARRHRGSASGRRRPQTRPCSLRGDGVFEHEGREGEERRSRLMETRACRPCPRLDDR